MIDNKSQIKKETNSGQSDSAFVTKKEVEYYRLASGSQFCPNRNEQQQRIYNEFFFVKNYERRDEGLNNKSKEFLGKQRKCLMFSRVMLLPLILGLLLTILANSIGFGLKALWIILMVVGAVGGIAFVIAGNKFKKIAEKYFKDYEQSIKKAPDKLMSVEDYLNEKSLKIKSMDLDKVGVKMFDFADDQEFASEPLIYRSQILRDYSYYVKVQGNYYSSTEQLSMWFFTAKELYLYKINFDMTCNIQEEETHEFFYNEIDDISTKVYKNYVTFGKDKFEICTITFEITVQGQVLKFEFDADDKKVLDLLKLRQLIRERKSNF